MGARRRRREKNRDKTSLTKSRAFVLEMLLFTVAVWAGMTLVFNIVNEAFSMAVMIVAGIVLTLSVLGIARVEMDPDSVRARQSDEMLKLASQTLSCMNEGLTQESARKVCNLLLPATAANAVAITDRENVLAYVGYDAESYPPGSPIRTQATHEVVNDGQGRVLLTREEIGLKDTSPGIEAAILAPLKVGQDV